MGFIKSIEKDFNNRKLVRASVMFGLSVGILIAAAVCHRMLTMNGCSAEVTWAKLIKYGLGSLFMLCLMGGVSSVVFYNIIDFFTETGKLINIYIEGRKDPKIIQRRKEYRERKIKEHGTLCVRFKNNIIRCRKFYATLFVIIGSVVLTGYLLAYTMWLVFC